MINIMYNVEFLVKLTIIITTIAMIKKFNHFHIFPVFISSHLWLFYTLV